jgi:hypothetical protein
MEETTKDSEKIKERYGKKTCSVGSVEFLFVGYGLLDVFFISYLAYLTVVFSKFLRNYNSLQIFPLYLLHSLFKLFLSSNRFLSSLLLNQSQFGTTPLLFHQHIGSWMEFPIHELDFRFADEDDSQDIALLVITSVFSSISFW